MLSSKDERPLKVDKKKSVLYIKKGISITSKKGILSAGDEIKEEYLFNGSVSLDELVKSGYVIKG